MVLPIIEVTHKAGRWKRYNTLSYVHTQDDRVFSEFLEAAFGPLRRGH